MNESLEPQSIEELQAFLNGIFEQDQSDPTHLHALQCYTQLQERESDFLGTDLEDAYWNAVSLEAFHIAQSGASKQNCETALQYLGYAIGAVKRVRSGWYGDFDWLPYLQATEAYLKADLRQMRGLVGLCSANRKVVEGLLRGLEERGRPDYARDY